MVPWLDQFSATLLAGAHAPRSGKIMDRLRDAYLTQAQLLKEDPEGRDPAFFTLYPYFDKDLQGLTACVSVGRGFLEEQVAERDAQEDELLRLHSQKTPFTCISFEEGCLPMQEGDDEVRALFYNAALLRFGERVDVTPLEFPLMRMVVGRPNDSAASIIVWEVNEGGGQGYAHVTRRQGDDPFVDGTNITELCMLAEASAKVIMAFLERHAGSGRVVPLPGYKGADRRNWTRPEDGKSLFPTVRIAARAAQTT